MARVIEQAGVSVAPTGSTGVQVNEFEAAIKSVTSSTTVGAVFVYDTRNDSDSGAWRKKARGSWYYETLNTATRGGRREFPSVAVIVVDNETSGSVYGTVTIYDGDDPSLPMWRVYNNPANNTMNGIYALNGRVYVSAASGSSGGGLYHLDFVNDFSARQTDASSNTAWGHQSPMTATGYVNTANFFGGALVNISCNDVAATIVEGSELGALGLPIPTIGVATDGGVSVIHPNGDVYDIAGTGQTHDDIHDVFFTDDGMVGYSFEASGPVTHPWGIGLRRVPFADETISGYTNEANLERYMPIANGNTTGLTTNTDEYTSSDTQVNAVTPTGKNGLAIGYGDRLSIVKRNTANMEEGAVAYITSVYNSGYLLGDIRGAFLANSSTADRSVKGNTLTANGTITESAVATSAELKAYNSFSASNYLSRANDTDFDFGTGDFSIMFWVKTTNTSSAEDYVSRADSTPENGDFTILKNASNKIQFYINNSGFTKCGESTSDIGSDWQQVVVARSGSLVSLYINGVREDKQTHSLTMTPSAGSEFRIGNRADLLTQAATGASLSLVRLSATAPTPQQVADIYEAEKPLFRAGAKCLLQGNSNVVNALGYDTSTNLLHAGTGAATGEEGVTVFKGLEAVDTFKGQDVVGVYNNPNNLTGWLANTIRKIGVAGGVSAYGRTDGSVGGVIVDLPAIDVRGDLNTADTKLPDDGKLHFTGVTTDATPTVIGNIPVAENEAVNVIVRIEGSRYDLRSSSWNIFGEIKQQFYRNLGGDVAARDEASKLINEGTASTDFDLDISTSAQTIRVKVTGSSAVRMQFNATVEVQRISEKQYER